MVYKVISRTARDTQINPVSKNQKGKKKKRKTQKKKKEKKMPYRLAYSPDLWRNFLH